MMSQFLFDTWSNSIPLISHLIKCFISSCSPYWINTLEISPTQVANTLIRQPKSAGIIYGKLILLKSALI